MTTELEHVLELILDEVSNTKRNDLIAQKLFVHRDRLYLQKRKGLVEPFEELPDFLRKSPLKVSRFCKESRFLFERNLVSTYFNNENRLCLPESKKNITTYWSGFRSCITADLSTGQLYRLKGVAVDNKPLIVDGEKDAPFWVWGGQFLRSAYNERDYSNKFNKILADNGIEPIMEYVGLYKLPVRARRKQLATSIIRVIGDTRLDEFFYALEYDAWKSRAFAEKDYPKLQSFYEEAHHFYKDIGYVTGKLKKLMDRGGLSWSDNRERTNAHIGNIVLYRADEQNLGVGLVDFDASCDRRDKSKTALLQQQRQERNNIIDSAVGPIVSPRYFGNIFYKNLYCLELRTAFRFGFSCGYDIKPKREISNKIGTERLTSLVEKLEDLGKRNEIKSDSFPKMILLYESVCFEERKIDFLH